jgi:hypothetical protein
VSVRLWDLDPRAYVPHPLHCAERVWPESNCYIDLWLEVLHAAGLQPIAALPVALTIDVEGDQWTFFKFAIADLDALYGVEVIELNVWRSLVTQIAEQVALGRVVIVELDAFYLPDTAGTSYRTEHVKTSIGIQAMDAHARRLGYFHNAGYFELSGEDFIGVFRLEGRLADPEHLPPYVEVAKIGRRAALTDRALTDASIALLRTYLARRPVENPFRRYAARFPGDVEWLSREPLSVFHNYAFATLRQCGAAFELSGAYLRWLQTVGECGLESAAEACMRIASTAKALQFKIARAVNTRKPLDADSMLESMAGAWDETMTVLASRYGS